VVEISFDSAALVSHGRGLEDNAAGHPPSCPTCQPAAPDEVSTAVAASFTAWASALELLIGHSVAQRAAGGFAVAATGVALDESDQEAASAISTLGRVQPSSAAPMLPTGPGQVPSLPAAPAVPAAPTPMPAETWSSLIHGGPGSQPLRTLASQFQTLAAELDRQAGETKRAAQGVDANWNQGNQPAGRNINDHASWLSDAADYARALASSALSAARTIDNARTSTPSPETFQALRSEYNSALQQYNASAGVVSEPLVSAKTNLTTAQAQAVAAQASYALAANTDTATVPAPPPSPPPIVGGAPGTEQPEQRKPGPKDDEKTNESAEKTNESAEKINEIKEDGPGGGEPGTGGDPAVDSEADPTANPSGGAAEDGIVPGDPAAQQSPLTPATDATANTAGSVLGSILGAVGQSAGGASGMMPGGGGSPLSGLSGMPSFPSFGGMPSSAGEGLSSEDLGFDDLGPGDLSTSPASSGGGGGGGGLPAGGPSSSVSAAAPGSVIAPPNTAAPTAGAAVQSGRAGAPMGGMYPPMMGGMGGNNSPERDKDVHPDRRVVHRSEPNTEAVFGELEVVRKRRGRRKSATTQEETDGDITE